MVGIFMLLGIIAACVLALQVAGLVLNSKAELYTVYAKFENIGSLRLRAPVRIGGVAIGIMFRNGGSSGGTDAIALIAEKYFKIKVSTAMMVMDSIMVLAGLYVYGLNSVMIGLISVFLMTIALDWTMNIYGGVQAKKFEIISEKYEEIAKDIHETVDRGTTILDVEGGYTGNRRKMLISIVSDDQYNAVKEIIDKRDPNAFVVISEAKDVNGEGFTYEPRI